MCLATGSDPPYELTMMISASVLAGLILGNWAIKLCYLGYCDCTIWYQGVLLF